MGGFASTADIPKQPNRPKLENDRASRDLEMRRLSVKRLLRLGVAQEGRILIFHTKVCIVLNI